MGKSIRRTGTRVEVQPVPPPARRPPFKAAWLLFTALLVIFYYWTATSSIDPFGSPDENSTIGTTHFYHLLTNGFLAGHLYLPVQPDPRLVALKNPLDANQNAGLRLHDASYYKGHFYLYFGAAPVVTLFLPWKVLTGHALPQNIAGVIYLSVGYVFSCLLLLTLVRAAKMRPHWILLSAALITLGFGQTAPIVARRALAVYEVPLTAGYCFFMAGMYFLARHMTSPEKDRWTAIVASLCLGITAGCRPHYGVVVALLMIAYLVYTARAKAGGVKAMLPDLARLGAPVMLCGLAIAWYNFARFGSPLDFGHSYQMTTNFVTVIALHGENIVPCLYFFLFGTPAWTGQFPFFQLVRQPRTPWGHPEWMPPVSTLEPIAGLFTVAPMCAAGFALPFVLLRKRRQVPLAVIFVVTALAASAAVMLFSISWSGSIAMRYYLDYAPALLVVSLFVSLFVAQTAQTSRSRNVIIALMMAGCVWSVGLNALLSINSYNHGLKLRNQEQFRAIYKLFGGDPENIRYPIYTLSTDAAVLFPPGVPGRREALLTSGGPNAGDFVFVQYSGNNHARFGYEHTGTAPVLSQEIAVPPDAIHNVAIGFDHTATDQVTLNLAVDGRTILTQPVSLYETAPRYVGMGQDPVGGPNHLQPFSGRLAAPNGITLKYGD